MVQDQKTNGSCIAITTRSGKILSGPSTEEPAEQHPEESEKPNSSVDISNKEKEEEVKKLDPGAVSIPCIIGTMEFTKALCYLGASGNLIPLTIYKKLGLGNPTPTNMRLVMAERSVKRPIGILYDVLVKVSNFIFPADFVILDYEVDFEVPIILDRPFLTIESVLINLRANELLFRVNDEVLVIEPLVAVVINYDSEGIEEYEEIACALTGLGLHSYVPRNMDLDLDNRPTPPSKSSIEEPLVLELKELPGHLRYIFLGKESTLPVIIAADSEKQQLLEKEVKFLFDDEYLKAFKCLKKKLIEAPIVNAPDWSKLFEIMCDASGVTLGAVLGQKRDKLFHLIYYASKALNRA
ncbi:uncharacterized protein LOC124885711 [Capsicum annuum]|uniref:uncharacterized protein LOC124885711 n=1 Tax=Capsicum annuum TaxID=4072 RepID=UPI001FB19007|nr:uncharacterized protein LOC124885711 [Capsicum annuum]